MAVKVTLNKSTDTLEFRPETEADNDVANYLCGLVQSAKRVVKSADDGTVAKSGITGMALVRQAHQEKMDLLRSQAETWEGRAQDWSLQKDVRDVNADRARSARRELAALEGKAEPEAKPSKPVSVTLPR